MHPEMAPILVLSKIELVPFQNHPSRHYHMLLADNTITLGFSTAPLPATINSNENIHTV